MSNPALSQPARPWMGHVLRVAGVYNVAWGISVILAPGLGFRLLGVDLGPEPDVALAIWQCVGMIVGVYGVGYWVAASDPVRHWPIILVGLLGKILGPIGFVWTASRDVLPWSMGWTILTNDLAWWIPFGLMLRLAWQQHRADGGASVAGATPAPESRKATA